MKGTSHGRGAQHPTAHSDALPAPLATSTFAKRSPRKCSANHVNRCLCYRQALQAAHGSPLVPTSELNKTGGDTPLRLAFGCRQDPA